MKPPLTAEIFQQEAAAFAAAESAHDEPSLYGVTDGKAIGTYLEQKLHEFLGAKYAYERGSAAKGIDFPALGIDLKTTSETQPQSSSPFQSARQKVLGLGYSLLVLVYRKTDQARARTGNLRILHAVYIDASRTADYQTTRGVREILERDGNADDLAAFLRDRNLPLDDVAAMRLAEELMEQPPGLGYLTISNALQWRLQYQRVIEQAGAVDGILRIR